MISTSSKQVGLNNGHPSFPAQKALNVRLGRLQLLNAARRNVKPSALDERAKYPQFVFVLLASHDV